MGKANQKPQVLEERIVKPVKSNYLLFLPEGYEAQGKKQWPLILFLHGAGERGANLKKVAVSRSSQNCQNRTSRFAATSLFPHNVRRAKAGRTMCCSALLDGSGREA